MIKRMYKWLAASLAALILAAAPAGAQSPYYFWFQVIDEQGRPYKSQTAGVGDVQCSIYRPNVHGAAILHTNASLTNAGRSGPLFSDTNGRLHFYSTTDGVVDVSCVAEYGGSSFVAKLDRFTHVVRLPREAAMNYTKFPVVIGGGGASVYQTAAGASLPQGALIRDVVVQNLQALGEGTGHLSVGFLGNHSVAVSNALVNALWLTREQSGTNSITGVEFLRPGYVSDPGTIGVAATPGLATHRGLALLAVHAAVISGTTLNIRFEVPYLIHVASGLDVSYSVNPGDDPMGVSAHVTIYWQKYHVGVNRQSAGQ
jgi:hypothetical protein